MWKAGDEMIGLPVSRKARSGMHMIGKKISFLCRPSLPLRIPNLSRRFVVYISCSFYKEAVARVDSSGDGSGGRGYSSQI
jgi:hypothetical protein